MGEGAEGVPGRGEGGGGLHTPRLYTTHLGNKHDTLSMFLSLYFGVNGCYKGYLTVFVCQNNSVLLSGPKDVLLRM